MELDPTGSTQSLPNSMNHGALALFKTLETCLQCFPGNVMYLDCLGLKSFVAVPVYYLISVVLIFWTLLITSTLVHDLTFCNTTIQPRPQVAFKLEIE